MYISLFEELQDSSISDKNKAQPEKNQVLNSLLEELQDSSISTENRAEEEVHRHSMGIRTPPLKGTEHL